MPSLSFSCSSFSSLPSLACRYLGASLSGMSRGAPLTHFSSPSSQSFRFVCDVCQCLAWPGLVVWVFFRVTEEGDICMLHCAAFLYLSNSWLLGFYLYHICYLLIPIINMLLLYKDTGWFLCTDYIAFFLCSIYLF